MRYILSDIHGCYDEYRELLEKIHFSDNDSLYILGDAMDRGPQPMKVIQDMLARPNITYIVGNHDYMMLSALKKLAVEITEENCETHLSPKDLMNYYYWIQDGGRITADQFRALQREQQQEILDYLGDALLFDVLEHRGKQLILVHAGIQNFQKEKDLEQYDLQDFIFGRTDYSQRYYPDYRKIVVTGHTPTPLIRSDGRPYVYRGNGHIAIDCGCVFGGNLAAYCVETEETVYVSSRQRYPDETAGA